RLRRPQTVSPGVDRVMTSHSLLPGNPLRRRLQRWHPRDRRNGRLTLTIMAIDQNRYASGRMTGIDILPSIADEKTGRQMDRMLMLRLEQKTRPRLSAGTIGIAVVETDEDIVEGERRSEARVHLVDSSRRLRASGDVRLVGDND